MSDLVDKSGDKLLGEIKLKHRIALVAVGELFIWIGKKLQKVKTYEKLEEIMDKTESKFEAIEKKFPDGAFPKLDK